MLKSVGDEEDLEFVNTYGALQNDLVDKEVLIEELEALNETLIVKGREMNDELQEARKELIHVSVFLVIYVFSPYKIHNFQL